MLPYRLSTASRDAMYSPSLSMEKGAYRMRAPRSRHAPPPFTRPRNSGGITACTALLVVFLTTAALSSFGTAYYLLSTRCDTRTMPIVLTSEADQEIQAIPFKPNSQPIVPENDGHEKFLSYLPHSGFHNQRIAFENALVLSRLLNRTLLVPPIRLGKKPFPYATSHVLRRLLAIGKEDLHHCSTLPVSSPTPPECLDWTTIRWDRLVDLSEIRSHQRLLQRWNMTDEWIWDQLRITEADVYTLADAHPYQYRFLDSVTDTLPMKHKYKETIYIPQLATCPNRLLQLGTLFGTSRLRLRHAENVRIRGEIRRSMAFADSELLQVANAIAKQLGNAYLGVHLRLGDGHFKLDRHANARLVWWKLVNRVLKLTAEDTLALEHRLRKAKSYVVLSQPPIISEDTTALAVSHPPPPLLPVIPSLLLPCRGARHISLQLQPLNTPLFISTDARRPHKDSTIALFLSTFPCTFFLSDFPHLTAPLGKLRNEEDGVELRDFFLPFLDAMVVGKAWAVVGTEGSTFSRFAQDVLWRTYHGWEIVQRG